MLRNILLTTGMLATLGGTALCAVIDSAATGLAAPESTVTFSEFAFADATPISTELANLGVTFTPSLFYRGTSAWEPQGINGPNLRSVDPIVSTFSINFDEVLDAAAFPSIASPVTPATITARLNGVDIESFTTEINLENNSWYGFTGIALDEIEVSYSADTRLRFDNIQFGAVVPEPGTTVLAMAGVLVLLFRRPCRG